MDAKLSTDDWLPQDTKHRTQTVEEHSELVDALLKEHASEKIRRHVEKEALFGVRYGMSRDEFIEKYHGTPLATGVKSGEVNFVDGRTAGKTFSALNALVQGDSAAEFRDSQGKLVYTLTDPHSSPIKFDMSYLGPPTTYDPYSLGRNDITDMYEDFKQSYYFATPPIKFDITAYTQVTQQMYRTMLYGTLPDEEHPQQPEEGTDAVEPRKPFRYSKYKDRAYMDSMVFWLTNPFKDDILACAETNS